MAEDPNPRILRSKPTGTARFRPAPRMTRPASSGDSGRHRPPAPGAAPSSERPPIGAALRLLRTCEDLTQTAASKLPGAPDFRTLSHWETNRKAPSLRLLFPYLDALGFDLSDLQDALYQIAGIGSTVPRVDALEAQLDRLAQAIGDVERSDRIAAQRLVNAERRIAVLEQRDVEALAAAELTLESKMTALEESLATARARQLAGLPLEPTTEEKRGHR